MSSEAIHVIKVKEKGIPFDWFWVGPETLSLDLDDAMRFRTKEMASQQVELILKNETDGEGEPYRRVFSVAESKLTTEAAAGQFREDHFDEF